MIRDDVETEIAQEEQRSALRLVGLAIAAVLVIALMIVAAIALR